MRLPAPSFLAAALVIASAVAAPASAEVQQKSDAGFVVREVATVPASPYEVWAVLTAPAKWWNPEHTWSGKADNLYIDSQATGCFCELMPVPAGAPESTRRGSVEHMRIINSTPGRVLRMTGALGPLQGEAVTGVLTMTLKPGPKGTRILWEYVVGGYMRYKTDAIAPAVDAMLAEQMSRLAAQLGGAAEAPVAPPEPPKGESSTPAGEPSAPAAEPTAASPQPEADTKPAVAKRAVKPKAGAPKAGAAKGATVKPKSASAKPAPSAPKAEAPVDGPPSAPSPEPSPEQAPDPGPQPSSDAITPRPPV
ncbi:MAG: SRPBCC family protein [Novosphingobium sp.]